MSEGEGSRGGHVIGHTKSGKPVYGDSRLALGAFHPSSRFSKQDHRDASTLHHVAGNMAFEQGKTAAVRQHRALAFKHYTAAGG
jgi:hypothetical protein